MGKLRALVLASGILLGILSLYGIVHGMAMEQIGAGNDHYSSGWPKGMMDFVKHPSRVYSMWCNGNEDFYFKATPVEVNELLALFSKVRLRDHEVRIEAGRPSVKSFHGQVFEYNVSLHIYERWMSLDSNNADTLEPCLKIFAGDDGALLKQLKLPDNVIVTGAVGNSGLQSKKAMPVRKAWYGRVDFPIADFENHVFVQIAFWEKDFKDGIRLAEADREGFFKVVLSDQEISGLVKGNPWLTMTVGNWATELKKEDARFPVQMLTPEKEKALPQKITRPKFYYGRILCEDGSPPVVDPKKGPAARISVLFDYAGSADLDAEGYFQVFLQPEQFERLKAAKAGTNIYCPTEEKDRSTAMYAFPAGLLSLDKAKAGVVKIKKPVYEAPPVYKAPEESMTF